MENKDCESVYLVVYGLNFCDEDDKRRAKDRAGKKRRSIQPWKVVNPRNVLTEGRCNDLLRERSWNELLSSVGRTRCTTGSVVVEMQVPPSTAVVLQFLLSENREFGEEFVNNMAHLADLEVIGNCNWYGCSIEKSMNEEIVLDESDDVVPQQSCQTYCTIFKTTPFSKLSGSQFCLGVSSIITFLKCNAWNKAHQRCMLLCFNQFTTVYIDNIYSRSKNLVPNWWTDQILHMLNSCRLLNGFPLSHQLTHPKDDYYLLITFDNNEAFQACAKRVVVESFRKEGIQVYDEENFDFDENSFRERTDK